MPPAPRPGRRGRHPPAMGRGCSPHPYAAGTWGRNRQLWSRQAIAFLSPACPRVVSDCERADLIPDWHWASMLDFSLASRVLLYKAVQREVTSNRTPVTLPIVRSFFTPSATEG